MYTCRHPVCHASFMSSSLSSLHAYIFPVYYRSPEDREDWKRKGRDGLERRTRQEQNRDRRGRIGIGQSLFFIFGTGENTISSKEGRTYLADLPLLCPDSPTCPLSGDGSARLPGLRHTHGRALCMVLLHVSLFSVHSACCT